MSRLNSWFRFFRIVNLPTVPGDLLAGAAAVAWGCAGGGETPDAIPLSPLAFATVASCAIYLYGLADNDILGAKTDGSERPIPAGEISLSAARWARGMCFAAALAAAAVGNLPPVWWISAFLLFVAVVVYNRTKSSAVMGLCRGLNAMCGAAAVITAPPLAVPRRSLFAVAFVVAVWTAYIAFVTNYSTGESEDPSRRRRVGILIGAIVYLQLAALLFFRETRLLVAGAVMLVALRLVKRCLPKVSGS